MDQGKDKLLPSRTIETMMNENNVKTLHLMKMDIESSEFKYFFNIFEHVDLRDSKHLPYQILLEIHYWAGGNPGQLSDHHIENLTRLVDGWYDYGYRVVAREANPLCSQCYEVTLLRFRC